MSDKLEAVQKVSETLSKHGAAEERPANKDHFDTLMSSTNSINTNNIERIDARANATEEVSNEKNPILTDESVTSQKSGSATDQDQKKRQQQTEEVEGVASTRKKDSASSSTSASLMDEVAKLNKNVAGLSQATPASIKAQAQGAIAQIKEMRTKLSQAQGEIKPSYQTTLRNRLSHIDDNLKIALNKAGLEYTPAPVTATDHKNPIHKFINYLTSSQHHLNSLSDIMTDLSGRDITPAKMLAIQMKMTTVSQQLELFSNLLNKALESTKTIMNIQV